jgi:t-SNARE complex subunit (syntaxin)
MGIGARFRIDAHVEETSMNIEGANYHLLRHSQNIWRNRGRMIKVFGVLVVVFFIYFFVFMT